MIITTSDEIENRNNINYLKSATTSGNISHAQKNNLPKNDDDHCNHQLEELFQKLLVLEKPERDRVLSSRKNTNLTSTNTSNLKYKFPTQNQSKSASNAMDLNYNYDSTILSVMNMLISCQLTKRTKVVSRGDDDYSISSPKVQLKSIIARPAKLNAISIIQQIVISVILILLLSGQPSHQNIDFCPKSCTCDAKSLEVICRDSIKASSLPHTLDPSTLKMTINNAQTSQFAGLDLLTKLEWLDLAYNKIPIIDFNEISKNSDLKYLNVSHNVVVELKDSAVNNSLSEASLTTASISIQPNTEFKMLRKLTKINIAEFILQHNNLVTIRNYTFIRWNKLLKLDLSYNLLTTLELHSLFGLNKLEVLNLRGNKLMQVPSTALQSTSLSFAYKLQDLNTGGRLNKPSELKYLYFSDNSIVSLEADSFSSLEKAQGLHMDNCSLENIHELAFRGLHTLSLLSLNRNNLQQVPSKTFQHLGLLKSLRMNENRISSLSIDAFSYLVNLEELQLNNASFSEIYQGTFNGLDKSLKRLELAFNPNLTNIEFGTLRNFSKLTYLNLNSNNLRSLRDNFIHDKTNENGQLQLLDLRNNQLYCNCEIKWLTKWFKKFNETIQEKEFPTNSNHKLQNQNSELDAFIFDTLMDSQLTNELMNLTCKGPPALKEKLIIDLPENKLECLNPNSMLNVHIGFATLSTIYFLMAFVCLLNFCRKKKHLFVMFKENFIQNHIPNMVLPYSQNSNKDVDDYKQEAQLYSSDYEQIDYQCPAQIYTLGGYNNQPTFYNNHQLHITKPLHNDTSFSQHL